MKLKMIAAFILIAQTGTTFAQQQLTTDLRVETDYRKQVAGSDVDQSNRMFLGKGNDPLLFTHCYHFLQEQPGRLFLSSKYDYAEKNQGKLFDPPAPQNRAVQGQGVYCAKTPVSTIYYGDRVARIELADDVVIQDNRDNKKTKYCRIGRNQMVSSLTDVNCKNKPVDVNYYKGRVPEKSETYDWYVIVNMNGTKEISAIKEWSANDDLLVNDLKNAVEILSGRTNATEDEKADLAKNSGSRPANVIIQKLGRLIDRTERDGAVISKKATAAEIALAKENRVRRVYRPQTFLQR